MTIKLRVPTMSVTTILNIFVLGMSILNAGSSKFDIRVFEIVNQSEPNLLLVRRGRASLIPDKDTLSFLDLSVETEKVSALELFHHVKHIEYTGRIETMVPRDHSPDERHRINVARFRTIQDNNHLLKNMREIQKLWNPSIERWRDRYIMVTREILGGNIKFGWLNMSQSFATIQNEPFLGIGPGVDHINATLVKEDHCHILKCSGKCEILGCDPRILLVNESEFLIAISVSLEPKHPTRMAYTRLKLAGSTTTSDITQLTPLTVIEPTFLEDPGVRSRAFRNERIFESFQKNWPFFMHNNSVLWIPSLDPLIVVRTLPESVFTHQTYNITVVKTEILSEAVANCYWSSKYGDMRGGSPGRKIGRDRYLFFFHSRTKISTKDGDFNPTWTYLMGAFIMNAHPPFRMTSISRVPIFHKDFYVGRWDFIKYMDYVVYPMSYVFEDDSIQNIDHECNLRCLHRFNITLSFGYNDERGTFVTVNLGELLATMMHFEFDNSGKPFFSSSSPYDLEASQ
jgi:hypothetical protein